MEPTDPYLITLNTTLALQVCCFLVPHRTLHFNLLFAHLFNPSPLTRSSLALFTCTLWKLFMSRGYQILLSFCNSPFRNIFMSYLNMCANVQCFHGIESRYTAWVGCAVTESVDWLANGWHKFTCSGCFLLFGHHEKASISLLSCQWEKGESMWGRDHPTSMGLLLLTAGTHMWLL